MTDEMEKRWGATELAELETKRENSKNFWGFLKVLVITFGILCAIAIIAVTVLACKPPEKKRLVLPNTVSYDTQTART